MKKFIRVEPTVVQTVGGQFKKEVVIKRFQTEDGLAHEFTTYMGEGELSVAVLALTDDNKVIISRQFRAGREYYCDDLPGGGVEEYDEDIESAARRELFEETGYEAGTLEYLGKNSWMANSNLTSHYFLATECKKVGDPTRDQAEVDQGLMVAEISIPELIDAALSDRVADAVAVLMAYKKLIALEGTL